MRAAPMAVTQHPVRARATLARTLSTGRALCGWLALASLLAPLIGLVLCACTAGVTIAPPSPASPCTRTPACAPQAAMASRRENARTLSRRDYDLAPPSRIATSYLLDIVSEAQRERNLLHESSHANDLADTPEEHEREPGYAGHQASGSRGAHAGAHAVDGGGAGAGSQENAERPAARRCSTVGSPSIRPSRTSSAGIEAGVKVPQRTVTMPIGSPSDHDSFNSKHLGSYALVWKSGCHVHTSSIVDALRRIVRGSSDKPLWNSTYLLPTQCTRHTTCTSQ